LAQDAADRAYASRADKYRIGSETTSLLRDEHFSRRSPQCVHLEQVHHLAGQVVRVVIERDSYAQQCHARAAVLAKDRTWTTLATLAGPEVDLSVSSPYSRNEEQLHQEMAKLAARLLKRAAVILKVA
jgi:hypothetical protein